MAGRYDNPIPTRCLAPIDFLKIPAPVSEKGLTDGLGSPKRVECVYQTKLCPRKGRKYSIQTALHTINKRKNDK
jgi:hypothetical protein